MAAHNQVRRILSFIAFSLYEIFNLQKMTAQGWQHKFQSGGGANHNLFQIYIFFLLFSIEENTPGKDFRQVKHEDNITMSYKIQKF